MEYTSNIFFSFDINVQEKSEIGKSKSEHFVPQITTNTNFPSSESPRFPSRKMSADAAVLGVKRISRLIIDSNRETNCRRRPFCLCLSPCPPDHISGIFSGPSTFPFLLFEIPAARLTQCKLGPPAPAFAALSITVPPHVFAALKASLLYFSPFSPCHWPWHSSRGQNPRC